MRNPAFQAQRGHRLLFGMLPWVVFAMGPWDAPRAQSGRCTGADMTCLEEDRDSHIGSCTRLSYKRIALTGREPGNMQTGWYMYSHRGGGLLPLDAPGWQPAVEEMDILRDAEMPSDEVKGCLMASFWRCQARTFEDLDICVAEQYLERIPDECRVTLAKAPLWDDSPAIWHGTIPGFDGGVPLMELDDRSQPLRPSFAYGRYGGATEVLRWLDLADAVGANPVNICALRSAYECYTEGAHAGDASTCAAPLVGSGVRSPVP